MKAHRSTAMIRHLLLFTLAALPLRSHAIEEPDYQVTRQLDGNVELRQYAPYVVAEVELDDRLSCSFAVTSVFPAKKISAWRQRKRSGSGARAGTSPCP
jgi:hypothetical protein